MSAGMPAALFLAPPAFYSEASSIDQARNKKRRGNIFRAALH